MKSKVFTYGKYSYEYFLSRENRKTISLVIKPDKTTIVKVPIEAKKEEIEDFLKRKWSWMKKQISYFDKYSKKKYDKEYVTGESFWYLGRQYKLIVKKGEPESVKLSKGVLHLITKRKTQYIYHNKNILSKWYDERAKVVFEKRYMLILRSFKYDFAPVLDIRKMNKRWGSYLSKRKIYLNPDLIKAPARCIDYVITHELCHMKYKQHDRKFYNLLSSKCLDWEQSKEKLEILSIEF